MKATRCHSGYVSSRNPCFIAKLEHKSKRIDSGRKALRNDMFYVSSGRAKDFIIIFFRINFPKVLFGYFLGYLFSLQISTLVIYTPAA